MFHNSLWYFTGSFLRFSNSNELSCIKKKQIQTIGRSLFKPTHSYCSSHSYNWILYGISPPFRSSIPRLEQSLETNMRRKSSWVFDLKVSRATLICLKRTIYHNISLSYFLFSKTKGTEKTHMEQEIQSKIDRWKVKLKTSRFKSIYCRTSKFYSIVCNFEMVLKKNPTHYFILRILKRSNLKLWNISIDNSGIWDRCHPPTTSPYPHELKMKK